MPDDAEAAELRQLFAHQSITHQVDKAYTEATRHGRTKSTESIQEIERKMTAEAHPKVVQPPVVPLKVESPSYDKTRELRVTLSEHPSLLTTDTGTAIFQNYVSSTGPNPLGLDEFADTDHLFVAKSTSTMNLPVTTLSSIKYDILNNLGQRIYFAHQIPKRKYCSALFGYPYTFAVLNFERSEVLRCEADPASCGSPASVQIQNQHERFGVVTRVNNYFDKEVFTIGNGQGTPIFVIKEIGEGGTDFEVYSVNGEVLIGRISKKWQSKYLAWKSEEEIFGVSFSKDLNVKMKALLLGALLMLDFQFFETE